MYEITRKNGDEERRLGQFVEDVPITRIQIDLAMNRVRTPVYVLNYGFLQTLEVFLGSVEFDLDPVGNGHQSPTLKGDAKEQQQSRKGVERTDS